MKKALFSVGLLVTLILPVHADHSGDQGIGLMLGNPSGASYKVWLNNIAAIDAAVGVAQGDFDIHATLLWHNFTWAKGINDRLIKGITDSGDFPFYFGVGPRVLFQGNTEVGLRFPVGLSYLPNKTDWEFFTEVAPVLRFTPDTGIDADFAIGARYYFPAVRPMGQ